MPQQKPWERYSGGGLPAPIPLSPPDPYKVPKDAAETTNAQLETEVRRLQIEKAKRELAQMPDPTEAPVLAGKVNGDAFLKTLSPQDAAIAKGVADGRIAFPSGAALRSPYWQKVLTNVVNYDPSFDAINYNARAATRKDFTSGKSAMNIKALNTAIGHVGQLYDQIGGTTSTGGYPFATTVNKISNSLSRGAGNPGPTLYSQTAGAVASELTQVFRGTGGAEADVKRYLEELDPNASEEQKRAAIQNIMGLLKSRLDAIGDQYTKGMGTSAQPLNMLDDHAQHVFSTVMGQGGSGSPPPSGSGGPTAGGPSGVNPWTNGPIVTGDGAQIQIAGGTKTVDNPQGKAYFDQVVALLKAHAAPEQILAFGKANGGDLSGVAEAVRKHGYNFQVVPGAGLLTREVPNESIISRAAGALAGSPTGTFVGEAGNATAAGLPQWLAAEASGNPDLARARFSVARGTNPNAAIAGDLVGGTLGAIGGETGALKGAGAVGKFLNLGERGQGWLNFGGRRAADAAFGGLTGFTGAGPGQGGSGALTGTLAGLAGGLVGEGAGRYAIEPITRPVARGMFGGTQKPSYIDRTLSQLDTPNILSQLDEAKALNLPMTLADTNPQLRSLAGASVRRSPDASGLAENVLIPRNRGQIDRFNAAVNSDLGPTQNIPQLENSLIQTARTQAAPLYDKAYAAPAVASDNLTSILNTPFGKNALNEGLNIAKNERVNPNALSVNFDAAGDPVLNPVPNMRTLDLAKRGMDALLEKYRDPFTKRMDLSGNASAQAENGVRSDFLKELDLLNPDYAAARAAYAGPAAERGFINTGQDAFTANPDQLKFDLTQIPADKSPMIQLGYRDALTQKANGVGLSSNPFNATLGTPAAEARLRAVYPDSTGPDTLLRRRDLENQLQATSNDILGNSKTAQRMLADQAFGEGPLQLAVDLGTNLMTGQVPVGTIVKAGLGQQVKDALKFGIGKRAVAKADAIAPVLLNPDPAINSDVLSDALARSQGYRDYITRRRGMFGVPAGAVSAGIFSQ